MPSPAIAIARSRRAVTSRRNARHSTGPRTTAGKTAVRLNALTHGVYSREAVLPGEAAEDYDTLLTEFIGELKPVGPAELACVSQIADATWRLRRINVLEASLFRDIPDDVSPTAGLLENPRFRLFAELSKQYGRFDRAFHAARKALAEMEAERRKLECAPRQVQPTQRPARVPASFPPAAPQPAPSRCDHEEVCGPL
jgi:hypothetical protein